MLFERGVCVCAVSRSCHSAPTNFHSLNDDLDCPALAKCAARRHTCHQVINRGGEIISPFEVEEAVLAQCGVATHSAAITTAAEGQGPPPPPPLGVAQCAAFAAPHATLQEVVGVAIVMADGFERAALDALHRRVAATLHPAKWPQLVVFMDDLPKGACRRRAPPLFAAFVAVLSVGQRDPWAYAAFAAVLSVGQRAADRAFVFIISVSTLVRLQWGGAAHIGGELAM